MEAIHIEVLGRKYQVGFCSGLVNFTHKKYSSQSVTTCVIKTFHPLILASGVAIENPSDPFKPAIGEQYAFRRAVEQMFDMLLVRREISCSVGKNEKAYTEYRALMRQALWNARNTPVNEPGEIMVKAETEPVAVE